MLDATTPLDHFPPGLRDREARTRQREMPRCVAIVPPMNGSPAHQCMNLAVVGSRRCKHHGRALSARETLIAESRDMAAKLEKTDPTSAWLVTRLVQALIAEMYRNR